VVDASRPWPDRNRPDRNRPDRARPAWRAALAGSLALVALLTLDPHGTGWSWGSPAAEVRWYLTGLTDPATVLQLTGHLALLAAPAALLVVRLPEVARLPRLAALGLAAGATVELAQWALPLGRVVSPLDAVLDATGAVVAGVLAARPAGTVGRHRPAPGPA
jgi:hypothetical protein